MTQPQPNDELLSAYLDNELSPDERAQVEQRLATDSDYAATLEAYREQRLRLQALPKLSIDVKQRVMTEVGGGASVTLPEAKTNWRPVAAVVGSLAAMLLVGLFLFWGDPVDEFSVAENEAELRDASVEEDILPTAEEKVLEMMPEKMSKPESDLRRSEFGTGEARPAVESSALDDSFKDQLLAERKDADEAARPSAPAGGFVPSRRAVKPQSDSIDTSSAPMAVPTLQSLVTGDADDSASGQDSVGSVLDSKLLSGANMKMDSRLSTRDVVLVQSAGNQLNPLTIEHFQQAVKEAGAVAKQADAESLLVNDQQLHLGQEAISGRKGGGQGGRGGELVGSQTVAFSVQATPQQMTQLKELLVNKGQSLTRGRWDADRHVVPKEASGINGYHAATAESKIAENEIADEEVAQTYRVIVVVSNATTDEKATK